MIAYIQACRKPRLQSLERCGHGNVRYASLADVPGLMKKHPLYPRKQTFCEVAEIVSYVPIADI
jgi:hypothetical protein